MQGKDFGSVTPESRDLTTFLKLPSDYQVHLKPTRRLWTLLCGMPGTVCYMDDVVVFGENEEQLDQRLRQVFQRFEDRGLTLNTDKCIFGLQQIEMLGHVITAEGIKPDPTGEKLKLPDLKMYNYFAHS